MFMRFLFRVGPKSRWLAQRIIRFWPYLQSASSAANPAGLPSGSFGSGPTKTRDLRRSILLRPKPKLPLGKPAGFSCGETVGLFFLASEPRSPGGTRPNGTHFRLCFCSGRARALRFRYTYSTLTRTACAGLLKNWYCSNQDRPFPRKRIPLACPAEASTLVLKGLIGADLWF